MCEQVKKTGVRKMGDTREIDRQLEKERDTDRKDREIKLGVLALPKSRILGKFTANGYK